jgi:hypothetical protein
VPSPSNPRSNDLEIVLAYFELLDSKEQLEAYREIRDRLGAGPESLKATKASGRANIRLEALDAFRQVSEHLALESGKAPTPKQFDSTCKTVGLSWDRSKVVRIFGSWRRGRDTFLGKSVSLSPEERRRRKRTAVNKREGRFSGVKLFLETNPKATTAVAYDDWRESYNEALPKGRLPVVSATHVMEGLGWSWKDTVAAARGDLDPEEIGSRKSRRDARNMSYCRGPNEFYALCDIADALGLSTNEVKKRVDRRDFPKAVIQMAHGRLWLKEDIERYKSGTFIAGERVGENALRPLYLTREEVMERTGLTDWQLSHSSSGRKPLEPDVYLGRMTLWLLETVEAWEKNPNGALGQGRTEATQSD